MTKPEEPDIQQFWSMEAIGTSVPEEQTNSTFLQTYLNTCISQAPEGTYIARFPWKEEKPYLPSNLDTCKRRTCTLVNKLRQTPELLTALSGNRKNVVLLKGLMTPTLQSMFTTCPPPYQEGITHDSHSNCI